MLNRPATRLALIAIAAVAALLASCSSGGIPESSLQLRNAMSNQLISTSENIGTLTLNQGDTFPLLVQRTYKDEGGNTLTSDVTAFAEFKFDVVQGTATVDAFGTLEAVAPGATLLEVKFRADALDPYDIVRLNIVVP
jgi:hypothetical protein